MPNEIHPVADAWGDGFLVYEARTEVVTLSAMLRAFVRDARESQMVPVLVTSETAAVSWFVADAMRASGGAWAAVTTDGRFVDAMTGLVVERIEELWMPQPEARERITSFAELTARPEGALIVDVYSRERAVDSTAIGPLAEHVVTGLDGGSIVRWGLEEPLVRRFDIPELTRSLRAGMPVTEDHFLVSEQGSMVVSRVGRTRSGLLEHTRVMVGVGDFDRPWGLEDWSRLATHPSVTAMLEGLVERFRPTVAMVSYAEVQRMATGLGQAVGARRQEQPLALLIGPRAVRDLRLDVDALAASHDVSAVGLSRAPSLILRLSGPDPMWAQMQSFVHDLDEERLASALAMNIEQMRGTPHAS